jgi:hypothetical protein
LQIAWQLQFCSCSSSQRVRQNTYTLCCFLFMKIIYADYSIRLASVVTYCIERLCLVNLFVWMMTYHWYYHQTWIIRRELEEELGINLPVDAFELIFVFLQEWLVCLYCSPLYFATNDTIVARICHIIFTCQLWSTFSHMFSWNVGGHLS